LLPPEEDEIADYDIVGIVVEIEYAMFSELFGYELLYIVLCTDGHHRHFSEDELSFMP
jgi:hypothetical protein